MFDFSRIPIFSRGKFYGNCFFIVHPKAHKKRLIQIKQTISDFRNRFKWKLSILYKNYFTDIFSLSPRGYHPPPNNAIIQIDKKSLRKRLAKMVGHTCDKSGKEMESSRKDYYIFEDWVSEEEGIFYNEKSPRARDILRIRFLLQDISCDKGIPGEIV